VPPTPVEAQLRAFIGDLLDGCAVGVIILDPHLRVLWVNQALEQMLSFRREEVLGQDYRRLVHERIKYAFADPEGFASQALGPARGGELASLECHVPSATGRQECWLEYSSRQIQGGFFAGGRIEHFYDVTRRQAALDSLRRSQRLLERMFASMPDPVFVVDAAMVVVECNPAASHVFGYPPEELVGHDTTILYADPEGRQQFLASLETSLREKGYLFMSQLPMRRKNGEVFPVDLTVVPLEQEGRRESALGTWP
jgi:PAS domain S-box-containing protein